MKPLVAITQRVDVLADRGERRDALDQRWYEFVEACGGIALPIPNRRSTALELVHSLPVEVLVLSGGNDIVAVGGDAPERDETERALINWARARGRPIFAVCRGMQLVAHLFGARLTASSQHVNVRHEVRTAEDVATVNSYHRWCIDALPDGFSMVAAARDGTVESMLHKTEPIAAVMWHPERESAFSPADVALLGNFIAGRA